MLHQTVTEMKESSPVDKILPSELDTHYLTTGEKTNLDSEEDYEAKIQSALSLLASQRDIVEDWNSTDNGELCDWLWKALESRVVPDSDDGPELEPTEREWLIGTRNLGHYITKVTAFELHTIATQSSIFTDGSQTHWTLCLLICVYALRQCPTPLEKRWKRWQSVMCETVRFFQNFGIETNDHGSTLWTNHVAPACQHVIRQLPSEAVRVGLVSGLVGTSSHIVERQNNVKDVEDSNRLVSHTNLILQTVREAVQLVEENEEWIWMHPWRLAPETKKIESEEGDEDPDYEEYNKTVSWWSKVACKHEKVAGMDTSWNDWGIAFLAMLALDDRPQLLTPDHIWKVWFPHVTVLLSTPSSHPALGDLGEYFLEKLLQCIPEQSLPAVSSASRKPDTPYEAFQLLSNRLLAKPQKKNKPDVSVESKANTERVVELMKSLLSRFSSVNQVKIIRKIIHDCHHPGLQAKFMDLLRPIIFDETCEDAFWSYIGSFVKSLLTFVGEDGRLVHTEELINKVEIHVAALTMVQLWCMVRGRLPKKMKGHSLGTIRKALRGMMKEWMSQTDQSMPPEEYYRLFLLEGALEEIMRILADARQKRKGSGDDESESSLGSTTPRNDATSSDEKDAEDVDVVVGDAGIFD